MIGTAEDEGTAKTAGPATAYVTAQTALDEAEVDTTPVTEDS